VVWVIAYWTAPAVCSLADWSRVLQGGEALEATEPYRDKGHVGSTVSLT